MALTFDEKTKSYNVQNGDLHEVSKVIEKAEEILYNSETEMWEVDGALFSSAWLADKVIMMSHFINVIAHMQGRKGKVNTEKLAEVVEHLNGGKFPATKLKIRENDE